ncbi:MAG: hypothetical protein ACOY46_20330 [Bacillota bacterium]
MAIQKVPPDELKYSRILEIAPEVWMVEGYISADFFGKSPSSNVFILRDGDLVFLLDTGMYPYFKESILKVLRRCKSEGAKRLVLMDSQGHNDHAANNDVILEAGFEDTRFLLPENEVDVIDFGNFFVNDMFEQEEYFDPYAVFPLDYPPVNMISLVNNVSRDASKALLRFLGLAMMSGVNHLADQAEILTMDSRVSRKLGDMEFLGWEVGRFFAIHDGSHSPGHITLYDPKYKILLTGDVTVEINPPFMNTSMERLIEYSEKYRRLSEQGVVEIASDSHRSTLWWSRIMEEVNMEPLHRLQLTDVLYGKDQCATFFQVFENYYKDVKNEMLSSLAKLKEATILQVVEEFKASKKPSARFKSSMIWPWLPNRMEVAAAVILKEAGAKRRKEGEQILFSLPGR